MTSVETHDSFQSLCIRKTILHSRPVTICHALTVGLQGEEGSLVRVSHTNMPIHMHAR